MQQGDFLKLKGVILLKSGMSLESEDITFYSLNEHIAMIDGKTAEFISPGKAVIRGECADYFDEVSVDVAKKINYSDIKLFGVMYDPEGADTGKEFIMLQNTGSDILSLSGFEISAGKNSNSLSSVNISPGEKVCVSQEPEYMLSQYGMFSCGTFSFSIRNSGECVKLIRCGIILDCVYIEGGTDDDIPGEAWGEIGLPCASQGKMIIRKDDHDSDTGADWIESEFPL